LCVRMLLPSPQLGTTGALLRVGTCVCVCVLVCVCVCCDPSMPRVFCAPAGLLSKGPAAGSASCVCCHVCVFACLVSCVCALVLSRASCLVRLWLWHRACVSV